MTVLTTASNALYPARTSTRAMTAEDLWKIPRVGSPRLAADGRRAIVPVTLWDIDKNESKTRLWLVSTDDAFAPRALTSPELSASEPRLSPDGTQLAFVRKDANGKGQIHVLPLGGGEPRPVTSLALGAFDPKWLPDGSGLVFAGWLIKDRLTPEATASEVERRAKDPVRVHVTEERLYRFWDTWLTTGEVPHLFRVDLATGAIRDLTPESTMWFDWMDPSGQFDVSPDGRELAFSAITFDPNRSLIVSAIYTVPLDGGPVVCRTPNPPADHQKPRYSPDGKWILYGRTEDPEFYADRVRLWRFDRANGTNAAWLADWDLIPTDWAFADDGSLVLIAEQDARVRLFAWAGQGPPRAITDGGAASGLDVAGGRIAYQHQSLVEPAEVWTSAANGEGARRLTHFTDESTAGFSTGEVREMRFDGALGEPVQMFVVLPPGFTLGKKYPLVQVIHGGPHGISADQFHPRWNAQLFAAPGYVAALVNFQGSTSWGQDYAQRIQGEWAARPFDDVMKGTDVLIASGLVDQNRMAAAGGSYGGYMAAWIAGHTDRFRCIVNHAGVSDLTAQYASDVTQGRGKAAGGEAWSGLEKQDRWSPVRFASGMNTPMLVLHGERDYRVPIGQGLLIYGLLKAKGVAARLVYFADENHWVLKPKNSLLWYREVHDWLKRWFEA